MKKSIKKLFKAVFAKISIIIQWFEAQIKDYAEHMARDSRSLRVVLNWVYCLFYLWLVWYGVTHYKECINTAIVSTSTLVGAIFTGYVFSKSYEKGKIQDTLKEASKQVVTPSPGENEAGD